VLSGLTGVQSFVLSFAFSLRSPYHPHRSVIIVIVITVFIWSFAMRYTEVEEAMRWDVKVVLDECERPCGWER
jgi:hypothetical protein